MERTLFRGSNIELTVRVGDVLLTARRALDEPIISVGETVDVFIYRLFVTVGNKARIIENESLRENSIVI